MSDRKFGIVMAWLIPLIFSMIGPFSVNDLAVWIVHGQYFLNHHHLLRADIFSVLPTAPLIYPAWGLSILYAAIYRASNLVTVCLFHDALLGLLLWLIYRESILKLANPANRVARYATYAFWLGAAATFGERPSMVALLPMVLAFIEISRISRLSDLTPRRILKLALLNVLWVNIHGSFILLWLMLLWKTGWLVATQLRKGIRSAEMARLGAAHLCVGASALLSPFGTGIFPYVLETIAHSRQRLLSEWSPTTPFAHFPTGLLYFALLCGVLAWIAKNHRKADFLETVSSPFFFLLLNGATAIRNAALPFVVLLPALKQAGILDPYDKPVPGTKSRPLNALVTGLFVLILFAVSPVLKPRVAFLLPASRRDIFDESAPMKIAAAIRASGKTCPIFNRFEVGSFLMLELPNKIFTDTRNIIYSDAEMKAYLRALAARPGWEAYLDRHGACFAVLDGNSDAPLIRALRSNSEWKLLTEEKGMLLFERAQKPIRQNARLSAKEAEERASAIIPSGDPTEAAWE